MKTTKKIEMNRKELRKQKRKQKKVNRFNYQNKKHNKRNGKNTNNKEEFNDETSSEITSDEETFEIDIKNDKKIKINTAHKEKQIVNKTKHEKNQIEEAFNREKQEESEYYKGIKKSRIEQLNQQNEEEEKYINKYEKLLKLNKRGKKKSAVSSKFDDGLDYLLELCTEESIEKMYAAAKEVSESELKSSKGKKNQSEKLRDVEKKYFRDDDCLEEELDDFSQNDSEMESNDDFEDDESDVSEGTPSEESMSDKENSDEEEESNEFEEDEDQDNENDQFEDIYGRKRDKDGKLIEIDTKKYIPLHMRASLESSTLGDNPKRLEILTNLKKKIKGLVNRLTESNLHRITIEIENLYTCNARNDVNISLSEIIIDSLVSNVLTDERSVLEHTLLIATLHANIGSEIGAFFLQTIVENFMEAFSGIDILNVDNKRINNLILIICHLYTYRLFTHSVIFEILEKLCSEITEKRVDCTLLILRSVGFMLRKDDPLKLKEYILKVQELARVHNLEGIENSRIKFLLDSLMAIKNNHVNKISNFDPTLIEHFRKLLKQFIRSGKYITTLTVSLDDLIKADTRGKWWLVGSAWAGNEKNHIDNENDNKTNTSVENKKLKEILTLAGNQRMNTEVKKNIFCILMTAEDYLDAFEKILSSTKDERSIVSVIIHCCLSEKKYNPYYCVIAQKFCDHNRKFIIAFQYNLWDKIKDISNSSITQIANLSKFISSLVENGTLALSVLKIIEFNQMNKKTIRLLRQIIMCLLSVVDDEKFQAIFQKIASNSKLNSFKDQLRLFIKIFLEDLKLSEEKKEGIKKRLALIDSLLTVKQF